MEEKDRKVFKLNSLMRTALVLMMLVSIAYLVAGEFFLPGDRGVSSKGCRALADSFEIMLPAGDTEAVTLPATYDEDYELDDLTLVATLPYDPDQEWLMIWNMGHQMEVYIGDELRYSIYSQDSNMLGGEIAYQYDFVNLRESDMGKELRICYVDFANENENLGLVYTGDKAALLITAIKDHQVALVLAISLMVSGIVVAVVACFKSREYSSMKSVFFLGLGVFTASAWFLFNSPAAQFIFPNIEIAKDCAFFFASMISMPFLIYFETLLNGRYEKVLGALELSAFLGFCFLIVGYFIFDLNANKAFIGAEISAVLGLGTVFAIIMGDISSRKIKEYYQAALGTVCFVVLALVYVIMYVLFPYMGSTGILLLIGILVMFLAGISSAVNTKN